MVQNRSQECYKSMNSASVPTQGQSQLVQPEFRRQVEAWRHLLSQCGRKPSRKCVHILRVVTLRLQAGVDYWRCNLEPDSEAARAAKHWNKQGKKLRRALQPVREADVALGKLASLRASTAGPPEGQPHCARSCMRQIGELERRLTEERQEAAKKLMAAVQDHGKRLERASSELEAALPPSAATPWGCAQKDLLEMIAGLPVEFPKLTAECLHAYRKRIKTVRYLAEICADTDGAEASWQANALKRMQTAAGEWHDWQGLAKEAGHAFRGHAKANGLARLLEARAEESLNAALAVCRRSTTQLAKRAAGTISKVQ